MKQHEMFLQRMTARDSDTFLLKDTRGYTRAIISEDSFYTTEDLSLWAALKEVRPGQKVKIGISFLGHVIKEKLP